MPVVGHAFVGVATGLVAHPQWGALRDRVRRALQPLWIAVAVVLAYVPDLVNHSLQIAGLGKSRLLSHSLLFAFLSSLLLAMVGARWANLSARWTFAFSFFSIASHDLLDLCQATDRVPFWPFSNREAGFGFAIISSKLWHEAVIFGGTFAVFLWIWWIYRRQELRESFPHNRIAWFAYMAIAVVLSGALVTDVLRSYRSDDLEEAETRLASGDYRGAIEFSKKAGRWPSVARRAHLLTIEGEAYEELGDRTRAEELYLRAYARDPEYFYAVADLAKLYATSRMPLEHRRAQSEHWIRLMQQETFDNEFDRASALETLERYLEYRPGGLGTRASEEPFRAKTAPAKAR